MKSREGEDSCLGHTEFRVVMFLSPELSPSLTLIFSALGGRGFPVCELGVQDMLGEVYLWSQTSGRLTRCKTRSGCGLQDVQTMLTSYCGLRDRAGRLMSTEALRALTST